MSLERKKHSPGLRRGTGTSPSRSWTAVELFLVRMSSRTPRSQVVVRRLGALACTTILQLHQGNILEAAKTVACPFVHTCISMSASWGQPSGRRSTRSFLTMFDTLGHKRSVRHQASPGGLSQGLCRVFGTESALRYLRLSRCRSQEEWINS